MAGGVVLRCACRFDEETVIPKKPAIAARLNVKVENAERVSLGVNLPGANLSARDDMRDARLREDALFHERQTKCPLPVDRTDIKRTAAELLIHLTQ